jgi:hypothetical protein
MNPTDLIPSFDRYLAERHLALEAVVVGGSALALLGLIARETRDCDVIEPELPADILEASRAFARQLDPADGLLREDWLNNGPASLAGLFPSGWRDRLQALYRGQGLILWAPGRFDLLLSKLFALCDRGTDLADCLAFHPTQDELSRAEAWLARQDLHPGWPGHVRSTLADLSRRLGHGL